MTLNSGCSGGREFPPRVQNFQGIYFVYVIKSLKDGSYYKGYTSNLEKRLKEHNSGKSVYTSSRVPWEIVYHEVYEDIESAKRREKYFKTGAGSRLIKKMGL